MKKFIVIMSLLVCLTSIVFVAQKAKAYTFGSGGFNVSVSPDTPFGEGDEGISNSIKTVFNAVITISEIAFVLMFLIGGVMYLTSMGNEETAGKARKLMLAAIIGIVIVFAAFAVGTWILDRLKGKPTTVTEEPATPDQQPDETFPDTVDIPSDFNE